MAGSPGLARATRLTETGLVSAIREAINLQPGARLRRNNSGKLQDRNGRWVQFGQGVGSPDLIGAVTLPVDYGAPIARCFHLEVKLPGEKPTPDQLAWHAEARARGEFVAVVTSVEEALAALERCRGGANE